MKTPRDIRVLASQALVRARAGEPGMRRYARGLLDEVRRRELTEHSITVGRRNVTPDSYRTFLRHQLTTTPQSRVSTVEHPIA
ncbi:hypothetical protein [Saccharopolyspora rhizosphaerae]|uniref:hypothetical protein n=1 Tax=Saccharopolyspora rhizosphaerae TaxID=2492662 RepID=UPI001F18A318|nr:hypothetical protein [Saccharopolyspora rhizosphaerae]